MRKSLLLVSVLAVGSSGASSPPSMGRACPPVDAVVVDGFRPPAQPWLPGNRGLTYATRTGAAVRAVDAGIVRFSGTIAGEGYVAVERTDGTRVTYSFLSEIAVSTGAEVTVGMFLGRSGARPFQLGWKNGEAYRDPSALVIAACPGRHAVLVPIPPRTGP